MPMRVVDRSSVLAPLMRLLMALSLLVPALGAQDGTPGALDQVEVEVAVAARRLPRGTVLRAGDMSIARIVHRGPSRPRATPVAAGWVTRRVIQAGEVLRAPAVAPAPMVAAGSAVSFTIRQDGLELTIDGVAPVAGSLGDTIPVRLGARRRMTGVVTGPARVTATAQSRTP